MIVSYYPYMLVNAAVLRKELEKGLGREVFLRFDPQRVPTNPKANMYRYLFKNGEYYFSVYTHNEYSFAQKYWDYANEVSISSRPEVTKDTWGVHNHISLEELLASKDYINFVENKETISSWMLHLREKYNKEQKAWPEHTTYRHAQQCRQDADIVRLNDALYLAELIEEYNQKTGKYPFQRKYQQDLYVNILSKGQERYLSEIGYFDPDSESKHLLADDFKKEIERGLGRKIALVFDPEPLPWAKRFCYVYRITPEGRYSLAVPFSEKLSFTVGFSTGGLLVITNITEKSNEFTLKDLKSNADFNGYRRKGFQRGDQFKPIVEKRPWKRFEM